MAVLKSAGLESLLKSKNSIGDRNPFKRVSYTKKKHQKSQIVSPNVVPKKCYPMFSLFRYNTRHSAMHSNPNRTCEGVFVVLDNREGVDRLTRKDLRASATRSAASMV